MPTRQQVARALRGFGMGFRGAGTEFRQELDAERRQAMLEAAFTIQRQLQTGNVPGAQDTLLQRFDAIRQLGGDPSDTLGLLNKLDSGDIQGAFNDVSTLVEFGTAIGKLLPSAVAPTPEAEKFTSQPFAGLDEQGNPAQFIRGSGGTIRNIAVPPIPATAGAGKDSKIRIVTLPGADGSTRTVGLDDAGDIIKEFGETPHVPTATELKRQDAASERKTASNLLVVNMELFKDALTNPKFPGAVGPADARFPLSTVGALAGTDKAILRRRLERLGGTEVLELGARVLKGSQTEGEWARVQATLPRTTDHPAVWGQWYDDALRVLSVGRPELADQLEPMRRNVVETLGGEFKPLRTAGGNVQLPEGFDQLSLEDQQELRQLLQAR